MTTTRYQPGDYVSFEIEAWYVYELIESDTQVIRYVGHTSDPRAHLLRHNHRHIRSTRAARDILTQRGAHFRMRIVSIWDSADGALGAAQRKIQQTPDALLLNQ